MSCTKPLAVVALALVVSGCGWQISRTAQPASGAIEQARAQAQAEAPRVAAEQDERLRRKASAAQDCGADTDQSDELHLSLIEQMLDRNLHLAALAHLDALAPAQQQQPRARYLRAEAQRRGGQLDAAVTVYRELLGSCLAGLGHFGLGRIAAQRCAMADAQSELEQARKLRPVDARIHNDLGYVYLARGNYPLAEQEFVTAMQLTGAAGPAVRNLLTLLVHQQRMAEADALAREQGVGTAEVEALRDVPLPGARCRTGQTAPAAVSG